MSLQDLTPQLRTRLNKMERAVGWFVFLATALLLFGFGYYIYHTAERKGWFVEKAHFRTYLQSSAGLKVGDPVLMMGSPVGEIIQIFPMPPDDRRNVRVDFEIRAPDFRYIRSGGSLVKVNAGFLGQSQLEVTRGAVGTFAVTVTQPVFRKSIDELRNLVVTESNQWQLSQYVCDLHSNIVFLPYQPYAGLTLSNLDLLAALKLESNSVYAFNNQNNAKHVVGVWREELQRYESYNHLKDPPVELRALESVPVAERLDQIISQVQGALPGILALTNQLSAVLDNAANATSNLNATLVAAQPLVTNFALISGQLREPGGLGVWALGPNGNGQIQTALTNLNGLLNGADTNLVRLVDNLVPTLENLAGITGSLKLQVQANSNLLWGISKTVIDADDMVQGLKRHWLLRSAFKTKDTNASAATAPIIRVNSPRGTAQ